MHIDDRKPHLGGCARGWLASAAQAPIGEKYADSTGIARLEPVAEIVPNTQPIHAAPQVSR